MPTPKSAYSYLKSLYPEIGDVKAIPGETSPWRGPNTHPIFFPIVLNEMLGTRWMFYEPETLDSVLAKYNPEKAPMNTLFSLKACLRSDLPWNSVAAFNNIVVSFAGSIPTVDMLESVLPYEINFAIDTMKRIDRSRKFSEEITEYAKQNERIYSGFDGISEDFIISRAKRIPSDLAYHYERF